MLLSLDDCVSQTESGAAQKWVAKTVATLTHTTTITGELVQNYQLMCKLSLGKREKS